MRKPKITHAEVIHDAAQQIFDKYVDHCMRELDRSRGHRGLKPDRIFLERVEDQIPIHTLENIADAATKDFRKSIVAFVGNLSLKGVSPSWSSNPSLKVAILGYLAKYRPSIMETPVEIPRYRRITDDWKPAW